MPTLVESGIVLCEKLWTIIYVWLLAHNNNVYKTSLKATFLYLKSYNLQMLMSQDSLSGCPDSIICKKKVLLVMGGWENITIHCISATSQWCCLYRKEAYVRPHTRQTIRNKLQCFAIWLDDWQELVWLVKFAVCFITASQTNRLNMRVCRYLSWADMATLPGTVKGQALMDQVCRYCLTGKEYPWSLYVCTLVC